MKLTASELIDAIRLVPCVAIDLLLVNDNGQVLLGLRRNRPAAGTWFVPGGRILKDERIPEALRRIAQEELGLRIDFERASFYGVFEHFYRDNFLGRPGITTHYVSLAYTIPIASSAELHHDDQHVALRWFNTKDVVASDNVHENTRKYFCGQPL